MILTDEIIGLMAKKRISRKEMARMLILRLKPFL